MPAKKRLNDDQISELMDAFRSSRVPLREFCGQKNIPIPTFRRWKKEWDEKREAIRLANLPDKLLAWVPPRGLRGRERDAVRQDPLLALLVDLVDNLGVNAGDPVLITLCCDGLVVTGHLIGGQEYFDQMSKIVLLSVAELPEKYQQEVTTCMDKFLPDSERLLERREYWDEDYILDNYREAPEFIHLSEATISIAGQMSTTKLWRGQLSGVKSFWFE